MEDNPYYAERYTILYPIIREVDENGTMKCAERSRAHFFRSLSFIQCRPQARNTARSA